MKKQYRVGVWCAVSSKMQAADDKISLAAQEAAGHEFAESIGGMVTGTYRVPGHTRDVIFWQDAEATMDAYRTLRDDVESGKLDVLHAMDADRLGRDPALSNQLVSLCEKNGCEVYLAASPHVVGQKSAAQRYIFAITSTRAGEDQQRRVAYHRTGMINRVNRGLHPNHLPTGYRALRDAAGTVIGAEFDDLAPAVRLAGELFARGHTYRDIGQRLGGAGYRPRNSDHWDHTVVKRMVHRDIYGGIITWSDYAARTDKIPSIWSAPLYAAIRDERKKRARARGRRRHSRFWRVVHCGYCGVVMIVRRDKARPSKSRLFCQTQSNYGTCRYNSVLLTRIRAAVDAYLSGLFRLDDLAVIFADRDVTAAVETAVDETQRRIVSIEQKRTRLALALASGDMDVAVYRAADDLLVDSLNGAKVWLLDLERQLEDVPDIETKVDLLEEMRARAGKLWQMEPEECNALLRHLGLRVVIRKNRVESVEIV
jgi:DNA invertase Pin-like site-specific DNA recombinase